MAIGVVLPIAEHPRLRTTLRYTEVRDLARQAEADGFDSLWLFDHLLFRFPDQPTLGIWEIWTVLAALAEATERITLGTLVMCTAFRNPALLAKMAATLDEVSAGRLILGMGAGWHQPEFDAFGFPFDQRVNRFAEALQIIVPLLREGQVDFNGVYSRAPQCEVLPRGPRPNGPPILIGSFQPRMLRLTARYADYWNTCWLGQPTALAEPRAALEAACRAEGRDPATLPVTVGVTVVYQTPETPVEQLPPPEKALFGSAEEVAAGLRGYADLGVAHLICSLTPTTPESLAWLADVVRLSREGA